MRSAIIIFLDGLSNDRGEIVITTEMTAAGVDAWTEFLDGSKNMQNRERKKLWHGQCVILWFLQVLVNAL